MIQQGPCKVAGQLVFKASAFDEGDYVVSVRPESEAVWNDIPIGPVLLKSNAEEVAKWLKYGGALDLMRIYENMRRGKAPEETR